MHTHVIQTSLALLLLISTAISAQTPSYSLNAAGVISLGNDIQLDLRSYPKDWQGKSAMSVGQTLLSPESPAVTWKFVRDGIGFGTGQTTLKQLSDNRIQVTMAVTMSDDLSTQGLVVSVSLKAANLAGGTFLADGNQSGVFPLAYTTQYPYQGTPDQFTFTLASPKRTIAFEFPKGTFFQTQDDRRWADTFTFRIYLQHPGTLLKNKTYQTSFVISEPGCRIKCLQPLTIRKGPQWIPLDVKKDLVKNTALDFSCMPFWDAPAGKHGWLKAVNGHFAFEKSLSTPQRFWGVNLCIGASFLTHANSDRLVERLRRSGYNTIRIHNCESYFVKDSSDGLSLNPEMMDRFDYLFAKAKENGIYVTTDLYVSRSVNWRDIAIDQDGTVPMNLLKALILFHEPAYENWQAFAKNLLTHTNRHTGLRYADDPALPFIVLINEGSFGWSGSSIFNLDITRNAWKHWLLEKQKQQPPVAPDAPADCIGKTIYSHPALQQFLNESEQSFIQKARTFLRSLGVKALISDWNSRPYPTLNAVPESLDYIDMHFYVDHPQFINDPLAMAKLTRTTADCYANIIPLDILRIARKANRPFTFSEWNICRPNPARTSAGLYVGTLADAMHWDALWRFYYLGDERELDDECLWLPYLNPNGYFHMANDPFQLANDRIGLLIYMRREHRTSQATDIIPLHPERRTGRFTVITPYTAGGYGLENDTVDAGPLSARLSGSQATVSISSIDNRPIAQSRRLLLSFLTDLQKDNTSFIDESGTLLQTWGTDTALVRAGTAKITLALDAPQRYQLWSLDTDGQRVDRLPVTITDNKLNFTLSTQGPDKKAHFLFELFRE